MAPTSTTAAARWLSPLRYPGGKGRMADALTDIFEHQSGLLDIEIWIEPFAGGAGAGLHLLEQHTVSEVWLTEKNPSLAAFWRTVIADGAAFAARIRATEPDMALWHHARETVAAADAGEHPGDEDLAMAALVLNRCSRSGIVHPRVGPIGGKNQTGRWHLRSRWNSDATADRVERVAAMSANLRVDEGSGIDSIAELDGSVGIEDEILIFTDPPYLVQGPNLYAHGMTDDDHAALAAALQACPAHWLLTYDADERIHQLYPDHRILAYQIPATANRQKIAEEYAILSDNLRVRDDQNLLNKGATRWVQHGPTPAPAQEEQAG